MRFTQHTALKAAEQIAAGTPLAEIDETELSSLEAMIRAEIQDRGYRINAQFRKLTVDVWEQEGLDVWEQEGF